MKVKFIIYRLIAITILLGTYGKLNAKSYVEASISKRVVYPTEAVTLTIEVATSTWFTTAPDLYDLHVENSFTKRLGRPVFGDKLIDNKRYSTSTFTFQIYPMLLGEVEIEPIIVEFETPDDGDYKGVTRRVSTKALNFNVQKTPESYKGAQWLVAPKIEVTDQWTHIEDTLKIGDVIYRTITVEAQGIPHAIIPEMPIDTIGNGSIYTTKPEGHTHINELGKMSSSQKQHFTILFEQPGVVTFPEQRFTYWNIDRNSQVDHVLPQKTFYIKDDPNLTMLKTLQDSLLQQSIEASLEENHRFWNQKTKQLLLIIAACIVLLYLLSRIGKKAYSTYVERRKVYQNSGRYRTKRLFKLISKGSSKEIYNELSTWHMMRKTSNQSPSIKEEAFKDHDDEFISNINTLEQSALFQHDYKGQKQLKKVLKQREHRTFKENQKNAWDINPN